MSVGIYLSISSMMYGKQVARMF